MDDLLVLLVAGLATARLTRLIVFDEVTQPLRTAALRVDQDMRHVGYALHCVFCTGMWVAAGVVAVTAGALASHGSWWGFLLAASVVIPAVAQAGLWLSLPQDRHSDTGSEMLSDILKNLED